MTGKGRSDCVIVGEYYDIHNLRNSHCQGVDAIPLSKFIGYLLECWWEEHVKRDLPMLVVEVEIFQLQ